MKTDNSKGMALIIVLWISVILSGVAVAGSYLARIEMKQAYYPIKEMELVCAAMTGLEKVKIELAKDETAYDSFKSGWRSVFNKEFMVDDVTVLISIEDEESKANLNMIAGEQIKKIVSTNAVDLISYIKNKPLDCVDEIYLVKGFNEKDVEPLMKIVTVNTDGRININTAPIEVLMTLPRINYSLANAIVEQRAGKDHVQGTDDDWPYDNITQIESIVGSEIYKGIDRFITVKSFNFKVVLQAKTGKYNRTVESMLFRQGKYVQVRYWRES
jgi:type II secretory pathway component PulK